MNIKQIHDTLVSNYNNLRLQVEKDPNSNHNNIIKNATVASNALREIDKLDIIEDIEGFKQNYNAFLSWSEGSYSASTSVINNMSSRIDSMISQIHILIKTLDKLIPQEEGFILSVKLPDYDNLDSLPEFYKNLNMALSSVIELFDLKDYLEIYSFENGSKWNRYKLKKAISLELIIKFLEIGTLLYGSHMEQKKTMLEMQKLHQEIELTQDQLNKMESNNKQKEENMYDKYIEEFIEIVEKKDISTDASGREIEEVKTTIRKSFKSYTKLATAGTEFYADVNTDSEEGEAIKELVKDFNTSQKKINETNKNIFFEKNNTKSLEEPSLDTEDIDDEE